MFGFICVLTEAINNQEPKWNTEVGNVDGTRLRIEHSQFYVCGGETPARDGQYICHPDRDIMAEHVSLPWAKPEQSRSFAISMIRVTDRQANRQHIELEMVCKLHCLAVRLDGSMKSWCKRRVRLFLECGGCGTQGRAMLKRLANVVLKRERQRHHIVHVLAPWSEELPELRLVEQHFPDDLPPRIVVSCRCF